MNDVKYQELGEALLNYLPELKTAYEDEEIFWTKEVFQPHLSYSQILNPYIIDLINRNDLHKLKEVFGFVELLAKSTDIDVRNLVYVTILEGLVDKRAVIENHEKFMGEVTKRMFNELYISWRGSN